MNEDASRLPESERNRRYSAAELVEMTLAGHFCIRESIDLAIRSISDKHGVAGRLRMHSLPSLGAYATNDEIDAWQELLLSVEQTMDGESEISRIGNREDGSQGTLFPSSDRD